MASVPKNQNPIEYYLAMNTHRNMNGVKEALTKLDTPEKVQLFMLGWAQNSCNSHRTQHPDWTPTTAIGCMLDKFYKTFDGEWAETDPKFVNWNTAIALLGVACIPVTTRVLVDSGYVLEGVTTPGTGLSSNMRVGLKPKA